MVGLVIAPDVAESTTTLFQKPSLAPIGRFWWGGNVYRGLANQLVGVGDSSALSLVP
jgi:hypothetical protein